MESLTLVVNFSHFTSLFVALLDGNRIITEIARYAVNGALYV